MKDSRFLQWKKGVPLNVFSQTFDAVQKSWKILMADKELLVFPAVSGILCLIVSASFYFPVAASGETIEQLYTTNTAGFVVLAFLFYFVNYFLITFFNCSVIACAEIRMAGGDPTLADGFRASFAVTSYIAMWAIIEATVGVILRMMKSKGRRNLVSGSLGTMWTMASFFVPPRMVIDRTDPFTALKSAWSDIKGNWGHQMIGGVSFGLLGFLAAIPALLIMFSSASRSLAGIVIAAAWILAVSLVITTLKSIFQASLYLSMSRQ